MSRNDANTISTRQSRSADTANYDSAHSHTWQAILSDMHPYAVKPVIRRLVDAEICIQALRFSTNKSFKGPRESSENCCLCESRVTATQMGSQYTTGRHLCRAGFRFQTQKELMGDSGQATALGQSKLKIC